MKKVISCEYVIQEINKTFHHLLNGNDRLGRETLYALRQSCDSL